METRLKRMQRRRAEKEEHTPYQITKQSVALKAG